MHGHFSIFHRDFQHTCAGTKYSCGMHIIVGTKYSCGMHIIVGTKYSCGMHIIVVAHRTSCSVSPGKVF